MIGLLHFKIEVYPLSYICEHYWILIHALHVHCTLVLVLQNGLLTMWSWTAVTRSPAPWSQATHSSAGHTHIKKLRKDFLKHRELRTRKCENSHVWNFFHKRDFSLHPIPFLLFLTLQSSKNTVKSHRLTLRGWVNLTVFFIFVRTFIYNFCVRIDIIAFLGLINKSITVILLLIYMLINCCLIFNN